MDAVKVAHLAAFVIYNNTVLLDRGVLSVYWHRAFEGINSDKQSGEECIKVERHNLTGNPQAFIDNRTINEMLDNWYIAGNHLYDEVVKTKSYLTNDEFIKYLDITQIEWINKVSEHSNGNFALIQWREFDLNGKRT